MVRSHISNCDGEKLLSSAKGFHLNSFDLLPSVGVLQLISNNLWPCESFDDLHKQCYLPIMAADRFKEPRKKAQILSKPFMRHIFHHEKRLLMFNFDDQMTTHVWYYTRNSNFTKRVIPELSFKIHWCYLTNFPKQNYAFL